MNSDFVEHSSGVHRRPQPRSRHRRHRDRAGLQPEDRIRLETIGRTLSIMDATTNPYLGHLMSEDACWCFAHEEWVAAQPPRWRHQEWQRWQEEGQWLADKRARIEELARQLDLPPLPVPRPPWYRRFAAALRGLFA